MKRLVAAAVLATGLFGMVVGPLRAEVTAEQVRQAIDRGVKFLKNQQGADGAWTDVRPRARRDHRALHAGPVERRRRSQRRADAEGARLSPQDQAAKDLRRRAANDGLCPGRAGKRPRADPPQREVAGRAARFAMRLVPRGVDVSRHPRRRQRQGDNSNSQFALLALHEAERVGVSASDQTWRLAEAYWKRCQNDDGSWGYNQQNAISTAPAA